MRLLPGLITCGLYWILVSGVDNNIDSNSTNSSSNIDIKNSSNSNIDIISSSKSTTNISNIRSNNSIDIEISSNNSNIDNTDIKNSSNSKIDILSSSKSTSNSSNIRSNNSMDIEVSNNNSNSNTDIISSIKSISNISDIRSNNNIDIEISNIDIINNNNNSNSTLFELETYLTCYFNKYHGVVDTDMQEERDAFIGKLFYQLTTTCDSCYLTFWGWTLPEIDGKVETFNKSPSIDGCVRCVRVLPQ
jgi:hypothetical protein